MMLLSYQGSSSPPIFTDIVCIQIVCALDQLKDTRTQKTLLFKADIYGDVYKHHLNQITKWKCDNPQLWDWAESKIKDGLW